jgi:hypothetical protein
MTYMALLEVTDEEGRKWLTLRASTMEEAHAEVTVELIKEYDYSLYDLVEVTIVEVARSGHVRLISSQTSPTTRKG